MDFGNRQCHILYFNISNWSKRWQYCRKVRYIPVTELDLNDVSKSQFLSLHLKCDIFIAAKSCVEFNDIVVSCIHCLFSFETENFESWEFEKCAFNMKFIDRLDRSCYLCWILCVFSLKICVRRVCILYQSTSTDSHISCYLCWIFETLKAQIILWSHW